MFFKFLLQLIYKVLSISAVWQSDPAIHTHTHTHTHTHRFCHITFHHVLSWKSLLVLSPHFYKRRQGKRRVGTELCHTTFRDTEQRHFISGRLDPNLLGMPLQPIMHRTESKWETGCALLTSSGNHGISRDGCP